MHKIKKQGRSLDINPDGIIKGGRISKMVKELEDLKKMRDRMRDLMKLQKDNKKFMTGR
tara:strand:- start:44 stop:220 length:177 start_codon:yes stop_codon:yes gene_type:complete